MSFPFSAYRRWLIAAVLFVLLSVRITAQDLKFSHLTVESGLSQSVVNCILQDRNGFMWFGTQEGLNRYDGYNFTVYKRDPEDTNSLANNFVYTLKEDSSGNIWIGTNGGGLDCFDPVSGKFKHYRSKPNTPSSLSNNAVRVIQLTKGGKMWIGTDEGLNLFDPASGLFTRFLNDENDPNSLPGNRIFDIQEDPAGNLWIGTHGKGLSYMDVGAGKFSDYMLSDEQIEKLYPTIISSDFKKRAQCNQVRALYFAGNNRIWVGTDGGGTLIFDMNERTFLRVMYADAESATNSVDRIFAICDDKRGNVWMADYNTGLDILHRKSGILNHYVPNENDPYSLLSSQIKCLYRDRNGNMWVGSNGGVDIYFLSTSIISHLRRSERPGVGENTLLSSAILSVMEDRRGNLWIGTDGGGLCSYNRETEKYTQHPDLSTSVNNSVLSLLEAKDGTIWVGTYGEGINAWNPNTGWKKSFSPSDVLLDGTILCIAEDPADHSIWFGTFGAGIYRYRPGADTLEQYTTENAGLPSDVIYCAFFDSKGDLWVGTRGGGAARRDKGSGAFFTYEHDDARKNSLSNNLVYCITEDQKGNIWMSTSNGLNRLDRNAGTFTIYYERNGLPSDNIYAVVPDKEGSLWLSHNKGITRFFPGEGNTAPVFTNYGPAAGVQPSEFNQGAYHRNKKGEIFLGGQKGLNIIDPAKMKAKLPAPPVYIVSYKRFGTEIRLDSAISSKKYLEVTWRENYFLFEVAALDYVDPGKNMYQYRLEGFDDDWSPITNNRFISYTNLPGGNYVLRIRAADSNGNWNETGNVLYIHVTPPWWKTNLFYATCAIIIIAGVIGFTRYRTASIKKENRILETKVAERTAELAQKNADITASIEYAKRIQFAILPDLSYIYKHFPDSFILYKPKDIVSGDFYWFAEKNGYRIMIAADCTGHGVPGALMSVIGHNLLNQIILEQNITSPDEILNRLHLGVRIALKQGQHEEDTQDGMDISICCFPPGMKEVWFGGALRPLITVRNGVLTKYDSDRIPIGGKQRAMDEKYTIKKIQLEKGDMLYMFSDGYADQFGGAKGKKFMVKNLLENLTQIHDLPAQEQSSRLNEVFENWKDSHEQVDDVLVVGLRIR